MRQIPTATQGGWMAVGQLDGDGCVFAACLGQAASASVQGVTDGEGRLTAAIQLPAHPPGGLSSTLTPPPQPPKPTPRSPP